MLLGGRTGFGRRTPGTAPAQGAASWRTAKAMLGHSHADGHQADGGVGVPGDTLHHAAHGHGLHAASCAHLPEPYRAVIRACGTGRGWPGPGTVRPLPPPARDTRDTMQGMPQLGSAARGSRARPQAVGESSPTLSLLAAFGEQREERGSARDSPAASPHGSSSSTTKARRDRGLLPREQAPTPLPPAPRLCPWSLS